MELAHPAVSGSRNALHGGAIERGDRVARRSAGATKPCHVVASKPGRPSSATVGNSGIREKRLSVVTASGRKVPA
jgi:hypothetical protein